MSVTSEIMQDATWADAGKLSRKVATMILEHIRDNRMQEGDHLTETAIAETLNVSRTPVRAALEHLTELNVIEPAGPRRGFHIIGSHSRIHELTRRTDVDEEEALYIRIAEAYVAHRLDEQFTEADMLRAFDIPRALLQRVLQRMAGDKVVERNPGYGWRFMPVLRSMEGHDDSYRFRMIVEPAALREPDFKLDRPWAERSRREHETILTTPPADVSVVRFFAMNADFHETLALCSNNVFFHQAVRQQNQIRRFQNYA